MRARTKDKHLPPCVYLKHGAYWLVKKGKWERLGKDLAEALTAYAKLTAAPKGGMADLIDDALPGILHGKAKATKEQYNVAARQLKKIFQEFAPQQVKGKHVAKMKQAGRGNPNMFNRRLSVLRMVFDYAVDHEIVDSNPCAGIKRLPEKQRDRLLSPQEYEAIYTNAHPRIRSIMELAFLTGQRVMDVVNIHRADLKPDGIYFKQDKTDAKLVVRWTPELEAAIERAKALSTNVKALTLFCNRRGKAPDYKSIYAQWKAACEAAGVEDADMRDLRAMSATFAEAQGINPTKLLGHANEAMTARYLRGKKAPVVDGPSFRRLKDTGS